MFLHHTHTHMYVYTLTQSHTQVRGLSKMRGALKNKPKICKHRMPRERWRRRFCYSGLGCPTFFTHTHTHTYTWNNVRIFCVILMKNYKFTNLYKFLWMLFLCCKMFCLITVIFKTRQHVYGCVCCLEYIRKMCGDKWKVDSNISTYLQSSIHTHLHKKYI